MGKKGLAYGIDDHSTPYRPARLVKGKRWYIEFFVYDTDTKELRRVRQGGIKGGTNAQKLSNAQRAIDYINNLLQAGYVYNKNYSIPKPREVEPTKTSISEAIQAQVQLKIKSCSIRTGQHYSSLGNLFCQWVAEKYPSCLLPDFGTAMAYQYSDFLKNERKLSNRTHNNYIEGVRGLFSACVKRGLINDNPFASVELLTTDIGRNIAFSPDEQSTLEKWLLENDKPLYYYTRFIYYGFLRPIELCALRVRDIDLANKRIMLHSHITKNNKQQPISMNIPLVNMVQEMNLSSLPGEWYVFGKGTVPGPVSQPRNRVSERHRVALDDTGIKEKNDKVTMYSWRHTGAVRAFEAGANILLLKDMLRHYSLEETNIYLKSLGLTVSAEIKAMEW